MALTRRHFVQVASLSLLAHAALPHGFAQESSAAKGDPFSEENLAALDGVSAQTFEPLIGESFSISVPRRRVRLTLVEVNVISPAPGATEPRPVGKTPQASQQPANCFSLRFQGSGAALPQGTYTLHNASLGSFPLLLVPSAPEASPPTYTAIFNLLAP